MILTLEEVEKDYEASLRDKLALSQAIDGMIAFVHNPCDEDRTFLKNDIFKWQNMLNTANRLHEKIITELNKLRDANPINQPDSNKSK